MSRILSHALLTLLCGVLLLTCQNHRGTTIEGKITGANNIPVFLDDVIIGQPSTVLRKASTSGSGRFSLNFPEGLPSGIYSLRVGPNKVNLMIGPGDKRISITGDLATLQEYRFTVTGSGASASMAKIMGGVIRREYNSDDIGAFIDTTQSPLLGAYVAYRTLGANGAYLGMQRKALDRLAESEPNSNNLSAYNAFVEAAEKQFREQMARERVQIGGQAPEIALPSPNGKIYRLSDLKGKVVLLDFWASWCGPCRGENPNVVQVYNKYKDRGFTIFSVSLDGLNDNDRSRATPEQAQQLLERGRQNWIKAISDDQLSWPYHVSDLRQWSAQPAQTYGVRGIPRAFMINREGKIVATEVRGAANIEAELLKHL